MCFLVLVVRWKGAEKQDCSVSVQRPSPAPSQYSKKMTGAGSAIPPFYLQNPGSLAKVTVLQL